MAGNPLDPARLSQSVIKKEKWRGRVDRKKMKQTKNTSSMKSSAQSSKLDSFLGQFSRSTGYLDDSCFTTVTVTVA